jgi:hypothetical protein
MLAAMAGDATRHCVWCGRSGSQVDDLICRQGHEGAARLDPETVCICGPCLTELAGRLRPGYWLHQRMGMRATGSMGGGPGVSRAEANHGPPLLREIAVIAREIPADGRVRFLTTLEIWSDRVVLRWAEHSPVRGVFGRDPELRTHREGGPGWELADDLGTVYAWGGGGARGGGHWQDSEVEFSPPVPATAQRLTVRTPEGASVDVPLDT